MPLNIIFILFIKYIPTTDQTELTISGFNEETTRSGYQKSGVIRNYQNIVVGEGITGIGDETFMESYALKTIQLPTTLSYLGYSSFCRCSNLTSIQIPDNISTIYSDTFRSCTALSFIGFPAGLTSIEGDYTFTSLISLKQMTSYGKIYTTGDDGKILIKNNETAVLCAGGCSEITVPKHVVKIGRYFVNNFKIKKINFENGSKLKEVMNYAFRGVRMELLELPEGTSILHNYIFSDSIIDKIKFPSTITKVSADTFLTATSIGNIEIPTNCTALALNGIAVTNKLNTEVYFIPSNTTEFEIKVNIVKINYDILKLASNLTSLTTADQNPNFTAIDNVLYDKEEKVLLANAGGNKYVRVSAKCTSIGMYAFQKTMIENLEFLGTNCTQLSGYTLRHCDNLKNVKFRDGLVSIGNWEFYSCTVKRLEFPSSFKRMGSDPFNGAESLEYISFENCTELKSFPSSSFESCGKLNTIKLPPQLNYISKKMFYLCYSLKSIKIPQSVTEIRESAFEGTQLSEILFPKGCGLEYLRIRCFYGTNFSSFEIKDSVLAVESQFLGSCTNLRSIVISNNSNLGTIGTEILSGTNNVESFFIGPKAQTIDDGAFSQSYGLKRFTVSPDNTNFVSGGPILYTSGKNTVVAFAGGEERADVDDNAARIGNKAFYKCINLKFVSFSSESKLTAIGQSTFFGCTAITEIRMPGKVGEIGANAFSGCQMLSLIDFGSSSSVSVIHEFAFSGCTALPSVSFPASIRTIHANAFSGCTGLVSVFLPNQTEALEDDSFAGCSRLRLVVMCTSSQPTGLSERAFYGCPEDAVAIVSYLYKESKFCGVRALRALDRDCKYATRRFTKDSLDGPKTVERLIVFAANITPEDAD